MGGRQGGGKTSVGVVRQMVRRVGSRAVEWRRDLGMELSRGMVGAFGQVWKGKRRRHTEGAMMGRADSRDAGIVAGERVQSMTKLNGSTGWPVLAEGSIGGRRRLSQEPAEWAADWACWDTAGVQSGQAI